jgi:hypothetical protein
MKDLFAYRLTTLCHMRTNELSGLTGLPDQSSIDEADLLRLLI